MKILVSDIDGTLIHNEKLISNKNTEKMKELQTQGHLVILCTGRSLKEFELLQKEFQLPYDYVILNNGALILDQQGHKIYEKVISHQVGVGILDRITSNQHLSALVSDGLNTYTYYNGMITNYDTNETKPGDFKALYEGMNTFAIIAFHQANKEIEHSKKCYDDIKKQYQDDIEAYFNTHFVDVVARGCSKGNGIKEFMNLNKINGETWAIGDSHNDLSMILNCDYGYTFDYADIKELVPHQVHYVYEMIDEMLKNNA